MIVGYARSKLSQSDLVERIRPFLELKVQAGEEAMFEEFLSQCQYFAGAYDSPESFEGLHKYIEQHEAFGTSPTAAADAGGAGDGGGGAATSKSTRKSNRVFYLALPASVFQPVTTCLKQNCWSKVGWNRVVVEKPFVRRRHLTSSSPSL